MAERSEPVRASAEGSPSAWQTIASRTLDDYRQLGKELLEAGAPLVAYDMLAEGLKHFPADVRLRQLLALALARTGASRSASELLLTLQQEGHADEETLGMLARVHKDLWAETTDADEKRRYLQLAFQYYRDAHVLSGGYWSGINAATMALLLGDRAQAQTLAREVRDQCKSHARPRRSESYWLLATLGEAALILEDWPEAEQSYAQAVAVGGHRLGDLASTRRNARLIIRQLGVEGSAIEACLRVPPVVVFAGHLIDRPDRAAPRFPAPLEAAVGTAIRDKLEKIRPGFGYASGACGADILFLESLVELNGDVHIVLPYDGEQFIKDSVDIVPDGDWKGRHERLIKSAKEVVTASDQRIAGGHASYEYAFLLLDGMAGVRADELDTELVSMVVWDGKSGDGPGGTASTVDHWRRVGRKMEVIDLAEILARERPAIVVQAGAASSNAGDVSSTPPRSESAFEPQIVSMIFADARGFSTLTEDEIPQFVQHFLGAVASELAEASSAPILKNTWGDGLYFVFSRVRDAGRFALGLCEAIGRTDWDAHQLPKDMSLRIGLHAGPAYACVDPVTGRQNFLGVHVSRAARIEPITPPGQVYASRAFAALARSEQVQDFRCEYVGQIPLAKGYGTFPMYVVRHRRESGS